MLNSEQRTRLLQIARSSIESVLNGVRPHLDANDFDEDLRRPAGVFVSLHKGDRELRGCIGSIQPVHPLYQAVSVSAINAAFRDPRFFPVEQEELREVHIEISVMSPIVEADSPMEWP